MGRVAVFKLAFGSLVAAIAMFFTGFIYFAGPLAMVGYGDVNEAQSAAVQTALATNLPATGTYQIPNPSTAAGTTLYGKGPIATVNYNSNGFSAESLDAMAWGFLLYLVVAVLMAGALSQLDRRVPDFRSRAVIVVCFALASTGLMAFGDPIWRHYDWTYAVFDFVGNALMLSVAGLILARWFMPNRAEISQPSGSQKGDDVAPVQEIPPVGSTGL